MEDFKWILIVFFSCSYSLDQEPDIWSHPFQYTIVRERERERENSEQNKN